MIKNIIQNIVFYIYNKLNNKQKETVNIIDEKKPRHLVVSQEKYEILDSTYIREFYYSDNNKVGLKYKTKKDNKKCILYLPGLNDYMFQYDFNEKIIDNGYDIYCLNLRNFNEIMDDEKKEFIFYVDTSESYIKDMDILISKILEKKNDYSKIHILGHSTGGLIGTYYCHKGKYKNKINGLILNSPNLELNLDFYSKLLLNIFIFLFGYFFPKIKIREITTSENMSLREINYYKDIRSRYYFDEKYFGFLVPLYFGFFKVTFDYQNYVRKNKLDIPIIVFHSDKTISPDKTDIEILSTGDIVLEVKDIVKYSKLLGDNVKLIEIKNTIHNVFLSNKEAVDQATNFTLKWLNEN